MAINNMNPAAAASAYANIAKGATGNNANEATQQSGGGSFGDILKTSVSDAMRSMRAGEAASAQAVTGEAALPDVVQAVTSAEVTLQTVTAVRDKLVTAYQEIMRMPI